MSVPDACADRLEPGEIEGRAGDRLRCAEGNQGIIYGQVGIGGDGQLVVEHIRRRGDATEVEEAVVGEVDDGRSVRLRLERDGEPGAPSYRISDPGAEPTRIALLAVGADIDQPDRGRWSIGKRRNGPQSKVEARCPPVQAILSVVGRDLDAPAVEHKAGRGDAVGTTTDGGTEQAPAREIGRKVVVGEHDIGAVTVAIRDVEGLDGGPKRDDGEFETVRTAQPDPFDERTVRQVAEDLARDVWIRRLDLRHNHSSNGASKGRARSSTLLSGAFRRQTKLKLAF